MFKKIYFLILLSTFLSLSGLTMEEGIVGENPPRKVVRILAIDGGGIRGVIPAKILALLEQRIEAQIRTINNPNPNINLAEFFDIIGGTSTGGIIAVSLNSKIEKNDNKPKKAWEILDFYKDHALDIFPKKSKIKKVKTLVRAQYSQVPLANILKENLGEIWLKDTIIPMIIPAFSLGESGVFLFDSNDALLYRYLNFKMYDVALATSAAPVYFDAVKIENQDNEIKTFWDGGLAANDPMSEVLQKAVNNSIITNPDCDFFIISLGTGKIPPESKEKPKRNGLLGYIPHAHNIPSDANEERARISYKTLENLIKSYGRKVNYYRINPLIELDIQEMDKAKNVSKLISVVDRMVNPQRTVDELEYGKFMEIEKHLVEFFKQKFIEKQLSELSLSLSKLEIWPKPNVKIEDLKKN